MTKIPKLGLVVTALLTTFFTYAMDANGNYILNIMTGNGEVISFNLNTVEKSAFSIYDANHNLLYAGESPKDKLEISKTISLEGYPAGTYFLEVTESEKVVKHEIKVTTKKTKKVKLDQTTNESPAFRR